MESISAAIFVKPFTFVYKANQITAMSQDPEDFISYSTDDVSPFKSFLDDISFSSFQNSLSSIPYIEVFPHQGQGLPVETPTNSILMHFRETQAFDSIHIYQEEETKRCLKQIIYKQGRPKQNLKKPLRVVANRSTSKDKSQQYWLKNIHGTMLQRVKKLILKYPDLFKRLIDGGKIFMDDNLQKFKEFVKSFPSNEKTLIKLEARLKQNPEFGRFLLEAILRFLNDTELIEAWIRDSKKLSVESQTKLRDENVKQALKECFERLQANLA